MRCFVPLFALAALVLSVPAEGLCSAKHFLVTREHFSKYSSQAADLFFESENQRDKNILSHLTALSAIYADKALLAANLVDILENMRSQEDKDFVQIKIAEFKEMVVSGIPREVKALTELASETEDPDARAVAEWIVNELRVFERNVGKL